MSTPGSWLSGLARLPALAAARETLAASGRISLSGLGGPARVLLPLLLAEPPLLVVVPRERDVDELAQDLRTLVAQAGLAGAVLSLPAPGPPPFRGLPRHADAAARRAAALLHARAGAARALVASPHGLMRPSLAPHLLETRVVSLRAGDEMTPEILLEALDEGGYLREDPVTAPGQMARRGGILDVFPSNREEPIRIEFLGDTVESLRSFDPETQRASGVLDAFVTLPLSDVFATRSVLKALRPILDALLAMAPSIGEVEVQNRKTYVSLLTPRRTFASIEPTTKSRVDLGLRMPKDQKPDGRLVVATSMGQSAVTHRIGLAMVDDVDDEVELWLRRAHEANC